MFRCISFFLVAPILWMMLAEDATRSPRRILEDIYGFAYFVEGGVIRSHAGKWRCSTSIHFLPRNWLLKL